MSEETLYGLLAEFPGPESLVKATRAVRAAGFTRVETYSPFPIADVPAALGFKPRAVAAIFLVAAICGALGGFLMQYYAAAITYPVNVGGRPLNSWPSFVPITFEFGVLGGVLFGVLGMLLLNRLPRFSHPVFNVERFRAASSNAFFLCLESADPKFDSERARALLLENGATALMEVPA
ncbi:MAG TPA: DUF3341 domain-containing protein [Candidatus Methylacidiphilales bacterium]|nr:DUF3341 domain-containing protein [Candidatus Methylacidiphilales bacterium]